MPQNRVNVANECIETFNELKLQKKIKFIIYKLTDDFKEIVVEESSESADWEVFRTKLLEAKTKSKTVSFLGADGREGQMLILDIGKGRPWSSLCRLRCFVLPGFG